MTQERQDHLWRQLHKVQKFYYYDEVEENATDELLKAVNGNKDRLIQIMAVMLARQNDTIGSIDLLNIPEYVKIKNDKIDKILLEL